MDLSLIIVTYNSAQHITALLDSIRRSPDKLKKEVIIIDNASSDNSVSLIRRHPLRPTLIASRTNLGFSRAVNRGLKQAQGQHLMLLNPDTRLVGRCLTTLHRFVQNTTPLGAVAPRLLDPNGRPQPSIFRFPTILNAIRHYFLGCRTCFNKYLPTTSPARVDVAVMAAFYFPASTLQTIGYLSERYFLYYEDIDYCRRLRRARLPLYYLAQAKVKHVHGASGHFRVHHQSPLLKSAYLYHGRLYSALLHLTLRLGQKWQKLRPHARR